MNWRDAVRDAGIEVKLSSGYARNNS